MKVLILLTPLFIGCATKPVNIHFVKTLDFKRQSMSIDGGPYQPVPCSFPDEEPLNFANIPMPGNTHVRLECSKEITKEAHSTSTDMSILLFEPNSKSQDDITVLSYWAVNKFSEGDEDKFDSRSWIRRDPQGHITLVTARAQSKPPYYYDESNEDCDERNNFCHSCAYDVITYTWNAKEKTFDVVDKEPPFSMSRYTPPLNIHTECLNEKGQWHE